MNAVHYVARRLRRELRRRLSRSEYNVGACGRRETVRSRPAAAPFVSRGLWLPPRDGPRFFADYPAIASP